MIDQDDEEEKGSFGQSKYPCMPSMVAMQQMRNRLHLAYLGKKLMKWTAMATGRELRKISMDMHSAVGDFSDNIVTGYILLARARYFIAHLNNMVLENIPLKANLTVAATAKTVSGVKITEYAIIDTEKDSYPHFGLEKGGRIVSQAKHLWRNILKRMILMLQLRTSFMLVEAANKSATKKMNVLGKIVIPKTITSIKYIEAELEEKEREEFFRLKKVLEIKVKNKPSDKHRKAPKVIAETPSPPPPPPQPVIENVPQKVLKEPFILPRICIPLQEVERREETIMIKVVKLKDVKVKEIALEGMKAENIKANKLKAELTCKCVPLPVSEVKDVNLGDVKLRKIELSKLEDAPKVKEKTVEKVTEKIDDLPTNPCSICSVSDTKSSKTTEVSSIRDSDIKIEDSTLLVEKVEITKVKKTKADGTVSEETTVVERVIRRKDKLGQPSITSKTSMPTQPSLKSSDQSSITTKSSKQGQTSITTIKTVKSIKTSRPMLPCCFKAKTSKQKQPSMKTETSREEKLSIKKSSSTQIEPCSSCMITDTSEQEQPSIRSQTSANMYGDSFICDCGTNIKREESIRDSKIRYVHDTRLREIKSDQVKQSPDMASPRLRSCLSAYHPDLDAKMAQLESESNNFSRDYSEVISFRDINLNKSVTTKDKDSNEAKSRSASAAKSLSNESKSTGKSGGSTSDQNALIIKMSTPKQSSSSSSERKTTPKSVSLEQKTTPICPSIEQKVKIESKEIKSANFDPEPKHKIEPETKKSRSSNLEQIVEQEINVTRSKNPINRDASISTAEIFETTMLIDFYENLSKDRNSKPCRMTSKASHGSNCSYRKNRKTAGKTKSFGTIRIVTRRVPSEAEGVIEESITFKKERVVTENKSTEMSALFKENSKEKDICKNCLIGLISDFPLTEKSSKCHFCKKKEEKPQKEIKKCFEDRALETSKSKESSDCKSIAVSPVVSTHTYKNLYDESETSIHTYGNLSAELSRSCQTTPVKFDKDAISDYGVDEESLEKDKNTKLVWKNQTKPVKKNRSYCSICNAPSAIKFTPKKAQSTCKVSRKSSSKSVKNIKSVCSTCGSISAALSSRKQCKSECNIPVCPLARKLKRICNSRSDVSIMKSESICKVCGKTLKPICKICGKLSTKSLINRYKTKSGNSAVTIHGVCDSESTVQSARKNKSACKICGESKLGPRNKSVCSNCVSLLAVFSVPIKPKSTCSICKPKIVKCGPVCKSASRASSKSVCGGAKKYKPVCNTKASASAKLETVEKGTCDAVKSDAGESCRTCANYIGPCKAKSLDSFYDSLSCMSVCPAIKRSASETITSSRKVPDHTPVMKIDACTSTKTANRFDVRSQSNLPKKKPKKKTTDGCNGRSDCTLNKLPANKRPPKSRSFYEEDFCCCYSINNVYL